MVALSRSGEVGGRLKQPSTFRPFPGELVMFLEIAGLTGDYKVVDAIGRDTRSSYTGKWKSMIDMMLFPLYFLLAIVALAFLSPVLLSDLLGSMSARNRPLSRLALIDQRDVVARVFPIVFTIKLPITLKTGLSGKSGAARSLVVKSVVTSRIGSSLFLVGLCMVMATLLYLILMLHVVLVLVGLLLFLASVCLLITFDALLARKTESIRLSTIRIEVLGGCRPVVIALPTSFMPFWNRLSRFADTGFTLSLQSIFGLRCAEKVSRRGIKPFFASCALLLRGVLGYSIRHSETSPLLQMCSLGSRGVTSTLTTVQIFPHYTTNPPEKPAYCIKGVTLW